MVLSTSFLLINVLVMSNLVVGITSLTGYDCSHPNSSVTTIALHHVTSCSLAPDIPRSQVVYVQVLSKLDYTTIRASKCHITKSSLVSYCGTSSHSSRLRGGFSVHETVRISTHDCFMMSDRGFYVTSVDTTIEGLVRNTQTRKQLVEIGSIDKDGNCVGASFSTSLQDYVNAIKEVEYIITLSDITMTRKLETGSVVTDSGITCKYSNGGCSVDLQGTYVWEVDTSINPCGSTTFGVIYEGYANITESKVSPKALVVEGVRQNFALALKSKVFLCDHEGYETGTEELKVIVGSPGALPRHLVIDDTRNIDTYMDMNLKFIYIERNIANRTTDLYRLFSRRYCEINHQFLTNLLSLARTNPEEFAWVYTGKEGYTAITRGEAVQLIQCAAVPVTPRPTTQCYNELPVHYHNASVFLKPSSRTIVGLGSEVPCAGPIPTLYLINGNWMKVGGDLSPPHDPIQLTAEFKEKWEYGLVKSTGNVGYLTNEQIQLYRKSVVGPMERKAVADTFFSRVISHGAISNQGLDFNSGLNTDDLHQSISDTVISRVYGIWTFVIKHLGAILGFAILWDIICGLISFIFNCWMLFCKFGLSTMMLSAIWSTCAKHLLYGDLMAHRLRRKPKSDTPEQHPLVEVFSSSSQVGAPVVIKGYDDCGRPRLQG